MNKLATATSLNEFPTEGVMSISSKDSGGNIDGIQSAIWLNGFCIFFCPILYFIFSSFYVIILELICIPISIRYALKNPPWTLTLDFDRRTYEYIIGYRNKKTASSGVFADIQGVSMNESMHDSYLSILIASNSTELSFRKVTDKIAAKIQARQIAEAFGVPALSNATFQDGKWDGTRI